MARNNADKAPSPPEDDADLRVAILMAHPEITSISDLAGKSVAIDDNIPRRMEMSGSRSWQPVRLKSN